MSFFLNLVNLDNVPSGHTTEHLFRVKVIEVKRKRMSQHHALSALIVILNIIGSSFVCAEEVELVDFDQLYESFLNNDNSSLELPQYKKRILISGVVLDNSLNFSGDPLLTVTSMSSCNEMARMTTYDAEQTEKMKKFKEDDEFKAICELGPTMGGHTMSLQDCIFK